MKCEWCVTSDAVNWCNECAEFCCQACSDSHMKMKLSRDHTIVAKAAKVHATSIKLKLGVWCLQVSHQVSNDIELEEQKRRHAIELKEQKRRHDIELEEQKRRHNIELEEQKRRYDIELEEQKRRHDIELEEQKQRNDIELEEQKRAS